MLINNLLASQNPTIPETFEKFENKKKHRSYQNKLFDNIQLQIGHSIAIDCTKILKMRHTQQQNIRNAFPQFITGQLAVLGFVPSNIIYFCGLVLRNIDDNLLKIFLVWHTDEGQYSESFLKTFVFQVVVSVMYSIFCVSKNSPMEAATTPTILCMQAVQKYTAGVVPWWFTFNELQFSCMKITMDIKFNICF